MRRTIGLALVGLACALPSAARAGDEPKKKPLDAKATDDTVYEGATADGLLYLWRGPKHYDAARGVGVTLILHGTGLDRRWGFANHAAATFRPDDVVISPDGTTPQGKGAELLGEPKDAKRIHALLEEVKKVWKVRGVYLYGHSQGSFFATYYAGEYPDDVAGVVAHASGIWTWTKTGKAGHHQAIVLMHGTQDPVVPYAQSPGGLAALLDAGYPKARLCPLEGWNHWPAEHNGPVPHTSQELAWVEGMTTDDPERLDVSLATLADVRDKGEQDWAGLWSLAKHVLGVATAKEATKARATKAVEVVEALAKKHVEALADAKPGAPIDAKGWAAHLPIFLRQFAGVPACDALAGTWKDAFDKHRDRANAHLGKYYPALRKGTPDVATAFDEGVAAITEGFLWCGAQDAELRTALLGWQKDAKKWKLGKKALKDAAVLETMADAWKKGYHAYATVCATAGDV